MGEGSFTEAWRTAEKEVVERLGAGAGGIEEDAEAIFEFGLTCEVGEAGGAQGLVDGITRKRGGVQWGDGGTRHLTSLTEKKSF